MRIFVDEITRRIDFLSKDKETQEYVNSYFNAMTDSKPVTFDGRKYLVTGFDVQYTSMDTTSVTIRLVLAAK